MAQKLVDLIKNKLGDDQISEQEIEDRINIEDLKKIYDWIIDEYNSVEDNNKMNDDDQRIRYLISIITSLHRLTREVLANKMLLDHELYVVICNKLSDILVQWKNEHLCQFESCVSIVSHNDIIIQSLISIICNMNLHKQVESDDSCGSASELINEISGVLFEMIKDNEELLIMLKNHKTVKENLIGACFPIWAFNVPLVISQILTDDEIKNLFNIKSLTESLTSFFINYSEGENFSFCYHILKFLIGLTGKLF
ncbi:unnamed protein product [Rotaria sp. Silwood1]|nr:unnamed protein product [Rotaria sp. Silwood1]